MELKNTHSCIDSVKKLKDIPLLMMRLILAYGFYGPAMMKWHHTEDVAKMFAEAGIPIPLFNAYLVMLTETLGFILLTFGLGTRLISIPLMIVMLVAIVTVHWINGFESSNNGFEIPLYYFIMLSTLMAFGPGKASLDYLLRKNIYSNRHPSMI